MQTLEQMRFGKDKPKDPVYAISGRLSHAVRVGAEPEVILELQRELMAAQIEKYLAQRLGEVPPTKAQARALCKLIMAAVAA